MVGLGQGSHRGSLKAAADGFPRAVTVFGRALAGKNIPGINSLIKKTGWLSGHPKLSGAV
ncbi:MAG: hypothetical protein E6560_04520 [Yersiniaceae bacterium]|nr:hypothetical protein [Yersiniaceae bacterium]